MNEIQTDRLRIIPCSIDILHAVIQGDPVLTKTLNIAIAEHWTQFGKKAFEHTIARINEDASNPAWWAHLPVLREENTLIGSCGYKGPPDAEGMVEIGYEVAPGFRKQGLATEIAQGLRDHAFSFPEVSKVLAHTMPEQNASTRVLEKCGFKMINELEIADEGRIWRWEILKSKN